MGTAATAATIVAATLRPLTADIAMVLGVEAIAASVAAATVTAEGTMGAAAVVRAAAAARPRAGAATGGPAAGRRDGEAPWVALPRA